MPKYWIEMEDCDSGVGVYWELPSYPDNWFTEMGITTTEGTPVFEAPDNETAIKAFEDSVWDDHPFEAKLGCVFSLFGEESETAIIKIGGVAE